MFCTNCGKEIIDTARFCNYCGSPVANFKPTPPSAPSPYPPQPAEQQVIPTPAEPPYGVQPSTELLHEASMPGQDSNEAAQSGTSDNIPANTSYTPSDNLSSGIRPDMTSEEQKPDTSEQTAFASDHILSGSIPESEPIPQQSATITEPTPVFDQNNNPYPMPGSIPKSGGSVSGAYSAPMGYDTVVDPVPPAPEKRERKYTLGHILLCLASTAVMAITAGIFAGLYFSVV